MKIVMVHPHEVFSSSEPWTTRVVNLGRELVRAGNEVKIAYFPLEWKGGAAFRRFGIEFIPFCRRAGFRVLFWNCARMAKLARRADIIHFQKCFHYASLPALFAGWLFDKPMHYDWDDWEEMIYYESAVPPVIGIGRFLHTLERVIPLLVDTVSVSSARLRQVCLESGVKGEDIFHVPVGADPGPFHPAVDGGSVRRRYGIEGPLVLYVGQLHGGQYVNLFIQACREVRARGNDARFMVVGDGVRARELRKMAQGLGLGEAIIFTGAVPADEVPQYIAACDVAVACFEDTEVTRCKSPLKIAEYLACGKPIVASRVGEVENMVGDAGELVEPGRPDELAEKILSLLDDAQLCRELGGKARRRSEEIFNWRVSTRALFSAYRRALRKNSAVI